MSQQDFHMIQHISAFSKVSHCKNVKPPTIVLKVYDSYLSHLYLKILQKLKGKYKLPNISTLLMSVYITYKQFISRPDIFLRKAFRE